MGVASVLERELPLVRAGKSGGLAAQSPREPAGDGGVVGRRQRKRGRREAERRSDGTRGGGGGGGGG